MRFVYLDKFFIAFSNDPVFDQSFLLFLWQVACMTGALWAKRGERDISRGARHEREARDEGKRKIKRLSAVHCSYCSAHKY